jgi:hypothetical protein
VAAALHRALGPLHRHAGDLGELLRRAVEAAAGDGDAVDRAPPFRDLLGTDSGEHDREVEVCPGQRAQDLAQQRGGARAGRAADGHARALAERRRRGAIGRGQALGGEHRRELLEARPLLRRLGRSAVHAVDPHQRRVALGPPRRADRARQLVRRAQLAAADLRG